MQVWKTPASFITLNTKLCSGGATTDKYVEIQRGKNTFTSRNITKRVTDTTSELRKSQERQRANTHVYGICTMRHVFYLCSRERKRWQPHSSGKKN